MQEYNQYNESINEDSEKEINQEMEKLDEEEYKGAAENNIV